MAVGIREPLHTVTTVDYNALVTASFVSPQYKSSIGHKLEQPLGAITTVNKASLVSAFLTKYYGSDIGQSLNEPLHTVTTKDRFGLVTIQGTDFQIVDIGMRMLEPHELFAAQVSVKLHYRSGL
jgi:DNA (cytosine-5)-methyltransferase 1